MEFVDPRSKLMVRSGREGTHICPAPICPPNICPPPICPPTICPFICPCHCCICCISPICCWLLPGPRKFLGECVGDWLEGGCMWAALGGVATSGRCCGCGGGSCCICSTCCVGCCASWFSGQLSSLFSANRVAPCIPVLLTPPAEACNGDCGRARLPAGGRSVSLLVERRCCREARPGDELPLTIPAAAPKPPPAIPPAPAFCPPALMPIPPAPPAPPPMGTLSLLFEALCEGRG